MRTPRSAAALPTLAVAVFVLASCAGPAGSPALPTSSAPASASRRAVAVPEECPPETAQFEFWVGEWDLAVTDPLGTGQASESVTKDRCAISEHYRGYFRGNKSYEATSENRWVTELRAWQQRYTDSTGTFFYTGAFADGTMTLYASNEQGQRTRPNRVLWTNVTPRSLDWVWQRSSDGGTTWPEELARIRYTRKG